MMRLTLMVLLAGMLGGCASSKQFYIRFDCTPTASTADAEPDLLPFNDRGEVEISNIVQAPGVSRDSLYQRALLWAVLSEGIFIREFDNLETIVLKGTGETESGIQEGASFRYYYTALIQVKEGSYRYFIKDIYIRLNYINTLSQIVAAEQIKACLLQQPEPSQIRFHKRLANELQDRLNRVRVSMAVAMRVKLPYYQPW